MAVTKGTEGPPAQTREGVPLEVLLVAMTGNIDSSVDLTVSFGGKRCETFMKSMIARYPIWDSKLPCERTDKKRHERERRRL